MSSKNKIQSRVPSNLEAKIDNYADENNVSTSEAAKQLIRRGVEQRHDESPGETLSREATSLSAVAACLSTISAAVGAGPWAVSVAIAGAGTTLVFGVFWLSIRVLAGRGDFNGLLSG